MADSSDPQSTPGMERLVSELLDHIERVGFSPDRRAGVRCGAGDAAAICVEIGRHLRSGRRSKRRTEMADTAERCADMIMAYYDRVRVHV